MRILSTLTLVTSASAKQEFYVALNGDDANDGSSSKPFSSLKKCIGKASNGDICYLGGGRYDRAEDQDAVEVQKSVTISGAKSGEIPAILDGSVELSTSWEKLGGPEGALVGAAKNCVYTSKPLSRDVSMLWVKASSGQRAAVGGEVEETNLLPMTPARYPNAKLSDDSVFDSAPSAFSGRNNGSMLYATRKSTYGNLIDDDGRLASSGIDFTGSIAVFPFMVMGSGTQGVKVKTHGKGKDSFTYDVPQGADDHGHTKNPYFFEGPCSLLDSEGEWCIDSTKRVHVWLDGCGNPNKHTFRGKVRDRIIDVSKSSVSISLEHLTLWGGNAKLPRKGRINLDTVTLLYANWHKRSLGQLGITEGFAPGSNCAFRMVNSVVAWDASASVFDQVGNDAYFHGNLFSRNCYALGKAAALDDGGSSNFIFEHNTIEMFNSFVGVSPGYTSTVAYNLIKQQKPKVDGAGVHVRVNRQSGVLIYRNWAMDMTVKGYRFDRVNSATATLGLNGTVIGNVQVRCSSALFKGDHHIINNNLCFDAVVGDDSDGASPALGIMMYKPDTKWSIKTENAHTVVKDNVADGLTNYSGTFPGVNSGNIVGKPVRPMLHDPDNGDFRPKKGSAGDAAKGHGPYPDPYAKAWKPGRHGNSDRSEGSDVKTAQAFYDKLRRDVRKSSEELLIV